MKIIIGADRRGMTIADHVMSLLRSEGHDIELVGPGENPSEGEYPEQAWTVGNAVVQGRAERGVLLSGSGIGMCLTANKIPGIRACVGHDEWTAEVSRAHHDSNVICIAADMIGIPFVRLILERWFETEFQGGRHTRRLAKIRYVELGRDPAEYVSDEPSA